MPNSHPCYLTILLFFIIKRPKPTIDHIVVKFIAEIILKNKSKDFNIIVSFIANYIIPSLEQSLGQSLFLTFSLTSTNSEQ